MLNKFNVINNHILLVTRTFEDQEAFLTAEDFEAMWVCMAEFEGLVFYNSGQMAGASEQHKHLQMVPWPLASRGPKVPIEPALALTTDQKRIKKSLTLPFVHAISPVSRQWLKAPDRGAMNGFQSYLGKKGVGMSYL